MTQPTSTLRPPGAADFGLLLLLALTWGSSFYFIKEAVETLPPLSLAVGRIAIGAAMLLLIARAKGQALPRDLGLLGRMMFLGIIGNSLPFFLIAWGEQYTPSNLAAILMATIPSFVIVLAHFFTHDEPMTLGKALGCLLRLRRRGDAGRRRCAQGPGRCGDRPDRDPGRRVQLFALRHPCQAPAAARLGDAGRHHPARRAHPADPGLAGDRSAMDAGARWQGVVLGRLARFAVDRRRQPAVLPAAAPGRRRLRLVQQLPGAADGPRLGLFPRRRKAELERAGRAGADPDRPRAARAG